MHPNPDHSTREEINRFCPSLKSSHSIINFREEKIKNNLPIIIQNDDLESSESEEDTNEDVRFTGKLDKWDKGARSWLSGGTMFFLIILFHILQVRSDLRKFTIAANTQLHEACSVLEDKTLSLQTALGLAAQDIGPVTFKFVRDLKTKIRSAFLFAGQIFGGKVRAALSTIFQQYYCLLVGVLVTFISLKDTILSIIQVFITDSFISDLCTTITNVVQKIMEYIVEPEKFFNEMIALLLDIIFDTVMGIEIPFVDNEKIARLCSQTGTFNFEEMHGLLRNYLTKLIATVSIILIIYNTFVFMRTIHLHETELKESKNELKVNLDLQSESESESGSDEEEIESDSCFSNAFRWIINFLYYEPFWMFICMGAFGLCHAYFSKYLLQQAEHIKLNIIDKEIDNLKDLFTAMLSDYVTELEISWCGAFTKLLEPMSNFIKSLTLSFKPIIDQVITIGKTILDFVDFVINWLKGIVLGEAITHVVTSILDCMFLRNFRHWVKIADMISEHLFGNKWQFMNGGIINLLKNSIASIFQKLQLTKYLKKLFSASFFMFMRLVAKRSMFLYVYLIVCIILISQGLLMIIIKFLLGYF